LSFIYSLINFLFSNSRLTDRSDSLTAMFTDDTISAGSMAFTPLAADTLPIAAPTLADQTAAQIGSLHQIDPDFNEVAFLSIAATSYTKAIQAEGMMSADDAKDVITQAYHDRLAARIADWQAQGYTRVVTGLNVDSTKVFKVSIDGTSQVLTVRVTGTGVRCTKDVSSGVVAEGSATSQTFTEYATFVRPAGSVTPKTTALGGAAHCPSCGAPAPATATVCPFCGTPLTPGGAAWLLDKVSQSAYA
jgi:predicted lipid-binding transport protein (Tim44 family)